jgi:hypothetical protein
MTGPGKFHIPGNRTVSSNPEVDRKVGVSVTKCAHRANLSTFVDSTVWFDRWMIWCGTNVAGLEAKSILVPALEEDPFIEKPLN